MADTPSLGYGKPSEATIDQVNSWMRSTPWYQQQMAAWGQDPGHPTLSKEQSAQILQMAQANGVVVDQGDMEVDNHGNFNPKGHKLRNTLIVAGIAGATIATMGAAGAFSGAAAGTGAAGTGAGATGAVTAGEAAAGGLLPSTTIGTGMMAGLPAGGTGMAAAGGGGILGKIGGILGNEKTSDILGAIGQGIGSATSAAGNNRLLMADPYIKRANLEQDQRSQGLADVYRASWYQNRQPSPYNPKPLPGISDNYRNSMGLLEQEGMNRLNKPRKYDVQDMPSLQPGTLEKIGQWAGPALSIFGAIGRKL